MERRFAVYEALEGKELAAQIELLKAYFQERRITVVIKTGNLTFQTEVATVLVNNAKFTQAKGKTKGEAEERAVRKAWEKALTRAKDSDLAWIQHHLQSCHDRIPLKALLPPPGLNLSISQSSPKHRSQPTSQPTSPQNLTDQIPRTSRSGHQLTSKLDTLIFQAAVTVKASLSPAPRRRLSARSHLHSSDITTSIPGGIKVSQRKSLVMPELSDNGALKSVLEEADIMKNIRRLEYRSLKEARDEMKRVNLRTGRNREIAATKEALSQYM
jgi:uncharacterized membrane protein